jgi:hypothetical protein
MAAVVASFLMDQAGLPSERVLVAGYGDQRPLALEGRANLDRRVDLILSSEVPTEPLPSAKAPGAEGFRQWLAASQQEVL